MDTKHRMGINTSHIHSSLTGSRDELPCSKRASHWKDYLPFFKCINDKYAIRNDFVGPVVRRREAAPEDVIALKVSTDTGLHES